MDCTHTRLFGNSAGLMQRTPLGIVARAIKVAWAYRPDTSHLPRSPIARISFAAVPRRRS